MGAVELRTQQTDCTAEVAGELEEGKERSLKRRTVTVFVTMYKRLLEISDLFLFLGLKEAKERQKKISSLVINKNRKVG